MATSDQRRGLGGRELRYVLRGAASAASHGGAVGSGASTTDAQLSQGGGTGPPAIGGGWQGPVGGRAQERADI